jgi:glyoxylase-like metal-dependent hydrolase (beta-lactamase superfamily II)
MTELIKVEKDLYYLDVRGNSTFNVSGIYLIISDGITLIETGTSLVAPHILDAVKSLGFAETDIKRAIVTHIHLDHSGGTGWLVQRLPNLQVFVHEKGLKHLQDPTILIESATTVYGSLDGIIKIHGEILPVPGENLNPVLNSTIDIGLNRSLQTFDAPGHASHHLCIFDPGNGCLYSGEALGHHHPESGTIQPAVAPPGFNYEASLQTLEKISQQNPTKICFSQYGQGEDPAGIIDQNRRQLEMFYELTLKEFKAGRSTSETIESILSELFSSTGQDVGLFRGMIGSIVTGYGIYFQRNDLI